MIMQSGISNVPTELLTEIFRLSVPRPLIISPYSTSDDLPWALLGICRRWRHIVTEMPELWTNIQIQYHESYPSELPGWKPIARTDPDYITRIAQETLLRSGNAPLSLKLDFTEYFGDDPTLLTKFVVHHSHRIKNLSLEPFGSRYFLSMPPLNFDCLEFVSIGCHNRPFEEIPCSVFDNAPLKFAELEAYELMPGFARSHSTHLTHLSIPRYHLIPARVHKILEQFPGLVFLQISLSTNNDLTAGMGSSSLPVFPSLQTLFVISSDPELLPDFFKPLILPNLTHLEIILLETKLQIGELAWDCSSVFSIVSSFRQLTTFKITHPIADDYDVGSFLLTLPNIVNLSLPDISQKTLRSIYSGELVPRLRILEIKQRFNTSATYLDIMKNRLRSDFLTQHLLSSCDDMTEELEQLENELIDQGLLYIDSFREETYVRMEEFLSPDFKLWDPMDLRKI